MGRLTRRTKDILDRPSIAVGVHNVYKYSPYYKAIDKLAHYEDMEEAGRLITLPCAVGDTVYLIEESYEDALLPSTLYYYIEKNPFDVWMLCGVGKTVFLTKEEAEAKLKELGNEI